VTVNETGELERLMTEVAARLFAPGSVAATLQRVVDLAVVTIEACDHAGILLVQEGEVVDVARSDDEVAELDHVQIASGAGPCVDALTTATAVYADDLADDHRWPAFTAAAAEAGIRSVLAHRLSAAHPGSLNLYARLPAAFGGTERASGLIFATLAGLALDVAINHEEEERRVEALGSALQARQVIGQAQGILIERERLTAEAAFDLLRRASQHLNVKLRDLAATLVDTGEVPPIGPPHR
jgi:hypothetical protein